MNLVDELRKKGGDSGLKPEEVKVEVKSEEVGK
jgi:hypothetical protein